MYDLLKEFIKPELLILIPVLWIIGYACKKIGIKIKYLSLMLGAVSIILCILHVFATTDISSLQGVLIGAFTAITQGVLAAGASVLPNYLIKRTEKKE